MRKLSIVLSIAAAAVLWVAVSAQQQEMKPKPGPGSGITNVVGEVAITNTPTVQANQAGPWQVSVENVPGVRVTEFPSPGFLRSGVRYEITWAEGATETVQVEKSAGNGWIEVERGRRWVNVTTARSIAEAR
jgi:hypothetical protein